MRCHIFNSDAFETSAILAAPAFWFCLWFSPMTTVKKRFLRARVSRFISRLSINAWKSSWLWLGDLYRVICITVLLLNTTGGCEIALDFRLKMISCACFFMICVETHFPLKRPSIYLCQVAIQFKSRGSAIMDDRKQGRIVSK